jgi:membrane-associated HD superfamily phosphohydrolase
MHAPAPARQSRTFIAVFVGGFAAGTFDLITAYITYGRRVPFGIASGLLGRSAFQGGAGVYTLGILLHYFIAFSAAVVYYAVSRKRDFLRQYPVICGIYYGIAVFLVMNLIVLPLSAIHARGPFTLRGLIQGLLVHMILIGIPIALSVRMFSARPSQ